MSRALTDHIVIATSFREDAPRPPVPGEEGEATPRCYPTASKLAMMRPQDIIIASSKSLLLNSDSSPGPPSSMSARRNQDGLGEPEGSASPDSPLSRWTKSLHSLLGDQDGALLFRTFLEREKSVDTLDFWFACNGFRQMDPRDGKTQRVAKAIYKRYVDGSVVARQLKPATKTFIRDSVKRQHIDSAMFDQAQTEIQTTMEENAYRTFLASDIYLDYVRTGGENGAGGAGHAAVNGMADLKVVCGYLPTLNEEEEWSCDFRAKALVGLSAKALRATVAVQGAVEVMEKGYRSYRRGGDPPLVPPLAPVSSTNDSEVSSDALTDDSMSVTDSSVDGIPPYKLGSKKHIHREMQRNMRMNSQVSLPAFPRTRRPPKDMVPMEPATFAALLTSRLERLKRERDTMSSLEERLQQIQEEEERDESEAAGALQLSLHPLALLPGGSSSDDDNAQAILDEHLSRVLKTPGCQSPVAATAPARHHSPRSSSPEHHSRPLFPQGGGGGGSAGKAPAASPGASSSSSSSLGPLQGPGGGGACRTLVSRQSTKHVHHHYIHHHASPKSKEQIEREATLRVQQGLCPPAGGAECHQPPSSSSSSSSSASALCPLPYQRSRSLGREMCGAAAAATQPDSSSNHSTVGRSSSLSRRGGAACRSGAEDVVAEGCGQDGAPLLLPSDTADRSQNVWQWILESERQGRHRSHSTQSTKKSFGGSSSAQTHTWGGGGSCGHLRGHQPAHPFIQDPAMPPLPPPNTLAQLEEACRRLEEVSTTTTSSTTSTTAAKTPKQRHSTSSLLQREKIHQSVPVQSSGGSAPPSPAANRGPAAAAPSPGLLHSEETKECKKASGGHGGSPCGGGSESVVTYFFCGEEIPYRRSMKSHSLTLGHFKEQLRKKGNYRYYFKKASDEFECGAVFEEVSEDGSPLPTYQGKILGKVERME